MTIHNSQVDLDVLLQLDKCIYDACQFIHMHVWMLMIFSSQWLQLFFEAVNKE